MKALKILSFSLTMLCAAHAAFGQVDSWTPTNVVLQGIASTTIALDWGQTLDIADNPERFSELNPILGAHPSRGHVNLYFAMASILNPEITTLIPNSPVFGDSAITWRNLWLGATIMYEGVTIVGNFSGGLQIKF